MLYMLLRLLLWLLAAESNSACLQTRRRSSWLPRRWKASVVIWVVWIERRRIRHGDLRSVMCIRCSGLEDKDLITCTVS
jgi:hypothetical protein